MNSLENTPKIENPAPKTERCELVFNVAKSCAGHDKGSWYAIISIEDEDGYLFIVDGKNRKLSSPKRKNIKHVEVTNKVVRLKNLTDKSLRDALHKYNFGEK